jgi:hypothetical protein
MVKQEQDPRDSIRQVMPLVEPQVGRKEQVEEEEDHSQQMDTY